MVYFSEIAASLYPWDIADEGIEPILNNLCEKACVNSVYLIAVMHHEKRPLTDFYYPHNPVRKTYCPEDSRVYFTPHMEFYKDTKIKPLRTSRDFLKDKDWLQILIDAARNRGLKTGVELSHTFVDEERSTKEFPQCVQVDVYGRRLGQRICFNDPDARNYAIGLFEDLVANYDIDFIQTCVIPFSAGRPVQGFNRDLGTLMGVALGGCFCPDCMKKAEESGLDEAHIKKKMVDLADSLDHPTLEQGHEIKLIMESNTTLTAFLLENPELFEWLKFRRDSITDFFKEVHEKIKAINPKIDLRLNAYISTAQELSGLDLRDLKPHLDSVRSSDYSEQSGDPARMEHKRRWLLNVRRAIGDEMKFLSAIGIRPKATPELIRQGVIISAQCGVDGLSLGHYDGATMKFLEAIKQGLDDAEVVLLR